jgi:hypothetical protein
MFWNVQLNGNGVVLNDLLKKWGGDGELWVGECCQQGHCPLNMSLIATSYTLPYPPNKCKHTSDCLRTYKNVLGTCVVQYKPFCNVKNVEAKLSAPQVFLVGTVEGNIEKWNTQADIS